MNLKQQVCTLRQANRLKELGVDAPSAFSWIEDNGNYFITVCFNVIPEFEIRAYTSSELGEMITKIHAYWDYKNIDNEIHLFIVPGVCAKEYSNCTEVYARTEFLIYLLENRE